MTLSYDIWPDARERMKTGIAAALHDASGRDATVPHLPEA